MDCRGGPTAIVRAIACHALETDRPEPHLTTMVMSSAVPSSPVVGESSQHVGPGLAEGRPSKPLSARRHRRHRPTRGPRRIPPLPVVLPHRDLRWIEGDLACARAPRYTNRENLRPVALPGVPRLFPTIWPTGRRNGLGVGIPSSLATAINVTGCPTLASLVLPPSTFIVGALFPRVSGRPPVPSLAPVLFWITSLSMK